MDVEKLFRRIARNKHKALPYDEKIKKHRDYVTQYKKAIKARKKALERAAFLGLDPVACEDPLGEIKAAIKTASPQVIRQAACNAYTVGHYSSVKIAAEFDQDIRNLIEFLETFDELQSPPMRIFIDLALSDPIDR
jgi:hypothetical protein